MRENKIFCPYLEKRGLIDIIMRLNARTELWNPTVTWAHYDAIPLKKIFTQ